MTAPRLCTWCRAQFTPRQPNSRFCAGTHRQAFHDACRRLGERMFAEGAVTIEQLRAEHP